MKRIDRDTVQKILDTADIVEVVSDFVTLKRRGANYIGLCPFHNERTPSFSVSKAKGICKCFSCGKGGSPVNFLMELEQMSFHDALRWLAKKYNIEIQEQELTDSERQEQTQRESMFAVNDFAMKHMEHNLLETADGQAIGYAYFRDRGISDEAIRKFHLGYALDKSTDIYDACIAKGYNRQAIFDTGLCIEQDGGRVYDRFKGRVIYPVHSISGKVVAFGGRTLRTDKKVAKYVNSPESAIYSKSRELYGLYQAKNAISRKDKCILVEGYMDVISMSQSGVENVVASSGTSLTEGQIRLIHRFTSNVTVIYDSDAAGIKASLRGIDMLLAEGLKVKVVLLPDGDDPDSFAQSHSSTEVEEYISDNETDFIRFKTRILLADAADDPLRRASVISDIVRTISVIPDEITRTVYIQECSKNLKVDEHTLTRQVAKLMASEAEKKEEDKARKLAHQSIDNPPGGIPEVDSTSLSATSDGAAASQEIIGQSIDDTILRPVERELVRYIVKFGMANLNFVDEKGETVPITVIDYITRELTIEQMNLTIPEYEAILLTCRQMVDQLWDDDYARFTQQSIGLRASQWSEGQQLIKDKADNLDKIKAMETSLTTKVDNDYLQRDIDYRCHYFAKALMSSPDDMIRTIATELATSRHQLSKVHSKFSKIETELDRLDEHLPAAIFGLKDARVLCTIKHLCLELRTLNPEDHVAQMNILAQINALEAKRRNFAKYLGERVVAPRRKF